MSEVIFDIEVENLDSPFEREKLESLPKAILVELLVRKIKAIGKAIEYIEENKTYHEDNLYCFENMLEDVIPLLDILKGVDKE